MECAESRALYKVLLQNGRRSHQAGQDHVDSGCSLLLHGSEALVTGTQLAVAVFQLTTDLAALVGLGEAALLLGCLWIQRRHRHRFAVSPRATMVKKQLLV